MKKFIPLIICFLIILLTIIPPLEFSINFTNSPIRFVWTFLFFGVLSFYFIFTKANIWFKILLPYLFLNSFLSRIPHLSMASFIWIAIGAYFYLLCLEIKDWNPIFKTLWCILALEISLLALKIFHKETLLNFGKMATNCFGSVGNQMQFKSLIIVLLAMLIQSIKPRRKYVIVAYGLCALFFARYIFNHTAWRYFFYARGAVWLETFKLSLKHPIIGYGLGTYPAIFHALGRGGFEAEGLWDNAHNIFAQFLFEAGSIGFTLLVSYVVCLLSKCRGLLLLGGILIIYTLSVHFPLHQNSTQLLLFVFLAYCQQETKRRKLCQTPQVLK